MTIRFNLYVYWLFTTCMIFRCYSEKKTIKIAVILPKDEKYFFSISKCVPAIKIGIERAYYEGYLDRNLIDFSIEHEDSQCNAVGAPLAAFDFKIKNKSDVFFGPCCDYSLAPVARYSQVWNKPVITSGGLARGFGEKFTGVKEYSMLTRVLTNIAGLSQVGAYLSDAYEWKKVKLIYDYSGQNDVTIGFCHLVMSGLTKDLDSSGVANGYFKISSDQLNSSGEIFGAEAVLKKQIGNNYAVIFMCASPDSIREIMLASHELGFTNGEYIFFNIDLFGSKMALAKPWYRENRTDNEKAREAYESVLTITLKKPDNEQYLNFSKEVKEKARKEFPDAQYDGDPEVNSFVGAFHDAVLLYALALNETLEANGDITNGTEITRRMWNRTFQGITGEVNMDANGDRHTDYSLLNYNKNTKVFDVAGNYLGKDKQYQKLREIDWPGGRTEPPPDTPKCGFDKKNCPAPTAPTPFPPWIIVTTIFSAVLLIIVIISALVYRRYRQEAELNSMTWRIKSEEIVPITRRGASKYGSGQLGARIGTVSAMDPNSGNRRDSRVSCLSRLSVDSINAMDTGLMGKQQQLFTQTAIYTVTNSVVALKSIPVRTVTVNRAFLMEIKSMKNLQYDHIVRFIGVCLDPEHEYIVTEYCQKGSLQDILENDQIELDSMFKNSLIQDVAKGMDYLHNSVIRYHGNLKSTNCVVDGRFVLKITDFGLAALRSCVHKKTSDEEDTDRYQICKPLLDAESAGKLWTAPELIDCEQVPTVQSYQKGDVYSFAIICQEVIYRMGVFHIVEDETLSPEDIIDTLRRDRAFRPTLDDADCEVAQAMLIRRCWAADPLDRPDFTSVKNTYRRFMKQSDSKGGNLVDNLLARMEQYANNLESLVEERTADYLEEKKRAEDLLYMMLPKSIARDMIKGLSVKAEWFDQVTIYFSDICGFTALSAASSPMQVVAMLNDLYTAFDNIVEELDVYKVETIGDAYMVVSGLPSTNGNNHAREIARMSLKLLAAVSTFKIRHKPDEKLKLRIGMHTGPVCAGIVGLKMPRYCLFGDTVNTASRMESNGEALRIHVSPSTKALLDEFGTFELELRGEVEMKGKGAVTTYWLLGEKTDATGVSEDSHGDKERNSTNCLTDQRPTSCISSSTAEKRNLHGSSSNDIRKSAPIIHPEGDHSQDLLNTNKPKRATFKEDPMEFHGVGAHTSLLNGHADVNSDESETTCTKV